MSSRPHSCVACVLLWVACVAGAQSLDQEMPGLAAKISKSLVVQGYKNIASVDFTDIQGRPTELGRYLSERLSVEMVSTGGSSMLDRGNIKRILAEHKLTEAGLVNPANAKRLGEFAGADAILIGNVTTYDSRIELIVKAISTEGARIVAAGRITFPNSSDFQQPSSIVLDDSLTEGKEPTTDKGSTSYQQANAIAYKDIGSLRVTLKSITPKRLADEYGREKMGIRCSFEYFNRETKRLMLVAMNAEGQTIQPGMSWRGSSPTAAFLRSSIIDDRGGEWKLRSRALSGLGYVQAGVHGQNGREAYNPSEITRLLRLRDSLGRDQNDPSDGEWVSEAGVNYVFDSRRPSATPPPAPKRLVPYEGNRFISGSTTTIEPGRNITVSMDFESTSAPAPSIQSIQFTSEIIVGVASEDREISYSLHTLAFDRITIPKLR